MKITLDDFINLIKEYNEEEIEIITKAYNYANDLHKGQIRQSGEPYIIHPLNVAYILAEMHADRDTVCAGLLHDTLEDTETTKEDIAYEFNQNVANLVDGVTKLSKMNFSSKEIENYANTRKIITGLTEDVRIIIIKLADRLHNMRTLQYKTSFKQKENSIETLELYVPLAYYLGAYRIKTELEDLSLRYLKPDIYKRIQERKDKLEIESKECLQEMYYKINKLLNDRNIPNEIKIRTKNIYGIYKRLKAGEKLSDIHDLLALKIMVNEVDDCYLALRTIHNEYHPINDKFKDYICNPKTNMYKSLHTTVFAPDNRLVQTQIRTQEMDKIASFGLTSYWDKEKGNARIVMQQDLKEKFQFFRSLLEISAMFSDNGEFINQVKKELFSDKVYIYLTNGEIIELPKGATIIDCAYKISDEIGNTMIGAYVNDKSVSVDYILKNKDRVRIITDDLSFGPRDNWEEKTKTSHAKQKIKEFKKKLN
ncbi:MAG: bifunctional (p)ppGpp synthetase/guanosine-3',5'-bis(diphosphate) 3'-pyrophosphohydrolase [Bacilli bacterium]|nr:bifunctional (p)ppGpp synthetase/guanosine-3',5'-bis(diphosphate) 3'-pyrophosphohydrolase [Bacilli bacterium]